MIFAADMASEDDVEVSWSLLLYSINPWGRLLFCHLNQLCSVQDNGDDGASSDDDGMLCKFQISTSMWIIYLFIFCFSSFALQNLQFGTAILIHFFCAYIHVSFILRILYGTSMHMIPSLSPLGKERLDSTMPFIPN